MYYQCNQIIEDNRFFDRMTLNQHPNFLHNDWILHSAKPLQKSIQKYAKFQIATTLSEEEGQCQQPRLLIFSVDVAEGMTVTFDSYPKTDGSRRSEYGEYDEKKGYQIVIRYDHGINIEHVMASGTIPESYSYAQVPTTELVQNEENERCKPDKSKNSNTRYFWEKSRL
jgi:NTE family protein